MKDETTSQYKYPRLINSRHDAFKVRTAPIFKAIEEKLFAMEWFIKHTPVDERAQEILNEIKQVGAKIVGTDYTSFEALFTKEIMLSCEMQLYKYMTKYLPDQNWYLIVEKVLTGKNVCDNKMFTVRLDATRMSGEMCTSLGNSFMNLMAFLYVSSLKGCKSVKGRVEGDDGIFTFYGPTPTTKDFEQLGLIIKIVEYSNVTEGSFCGIIADEDELINIREPIEAMLDFSYTTHQYAHAKPNKLLMLLRAKALSMAYQCPGCPILDSMAKWALRMTHGRRFMLETTMTPYRRGIFNSLWHKYGNEIPMKTPGIKTRQLMEKQFKVTVAQQLYIERLFNNKNDLEPVDDPVIFSLCNNDQKEYYSKFVTHIGEGEAPAFGNMYHRAMYRGGLHLLSK
jgi:hypothetical protein